MPLPSSSTSISRFFTALRSTSSSIKQHAAAAAQRPISDMAWRCSGSSNTELIENMFRSGLIKEPVVKQAFLKVDRANYAPNMAYEDSPQPIGHAATISAPHMHACAVENVLSYLLPHSSSSSSSPRRVLDVGSGSGYLTHVMAEIVGEGGMVVGLEHIQELCDLGERNARRSKEGREMVESGRMRFRVGDGRKGWLEDGRGEWDVIHVGAAAKTVHQALLDQLKAPGCMFIPVDDDGYGTDQSVWKIEKDDKGEVKRHKLFGVRYVPLTDPPKQ